MWSVQSSSVIVIVDDEDVFKDPATEEPLITKSSTPQVSCRPYFHQVMLDRCWLEPILHVSFICDDDLSGGRTLGYT